MIIEKFESLFGVENPMVSIALLITSIAIALVISFVIAKVLNLIGHKSKSGFVAKLTEEVKYPLYFLIVILSITGTMPYLTLDEQTIGVLKHAVTIFIIIGLAWLAINFVDVVRIIILRNYDLEAKDNLEARKVYTQFRVLEQILVVIIIIIALSAALMTFEKIRQLGVSILASAGVIGIIIGFAAQRSIATIVAGFQIAVTQPIRIDDVVIIEGEWGRIEEITLTYVVVKIWDERRLVVPVNYFIEKPFQNWTRVSADILGTVFLYTDYQVPFDELRKELTRLLEDNENWDGKVNVLQVTNATEKTVEIRVLMSAGDSGKAWNLRVHVREKLIEFIRENYPNSLPKTRVSLDSKENPEENFS